RYRSPRGGRGDGLAAGADGFLQRRRRSHRCPRGAGAGAGGVRGPLTPPGPWASGGTRGRGARPGNGEHRQGCASTTRERGARRGSTKGRGVVMDPTPHVAVVGGGITGLAAAYFLQELSRERGRPVAITLLEAGPRLGGKILTERVDGFCIEAGPDSFLARKPWARLLAERLGLGEGLVTIAPRHRRTYIVRQGQLHPIPEGLFMFVPLRMDGLARSQLLSPAAKERMAMEPSIPPGPPGDESIADFVARRVGQEALEQLAEPLLTGIYAGRADRLSIMATFPQFKE